MKGSDYPMSVNQVLMHWNGIPVLVTGEVLVHPSNVPLVQQPAQQVDAEPGPA